MSDDTSPSADGAGRGSDDVKALLRLMTWLSPAFPVGGFAYSGGLERAVADGIVRDAEGLSVWIAASVEHGAAWNDAVMLAEAHRAHGDGTRLTEVADLASALAGSAERHAEIMTLGRAFVEAASAWDDPVFTLLPQPAAYAVAVGAVSGAHGVAADKTIAAFLNAFAGQAVSAGIRLSVGGQKQGVAIVAALEPLLEKVAARAAGSSLDDLGSATVLADISSLRHETQQVRLFRS